MKQILLIIILFSTVCTSAQDKRFMTKAESEALMSRPASLMNKIYPDFDVRSGNKHITSSDLSGKITYINFWFSSCPPCMAEMEGLNKLYDRLKDKKDFQFISFTFDSEEEIEVTRKKYNIQYPIFSIPRPECYRLNGHAGFPTSFITDRSSIVRLSKFGGQIDPQKATKAVMKDYYPDIIRLLDVAPAD